jgi:predicted nucleic acid-binding protein
VGWNGWAIGGAERGSGRGWSGILPLWFQGRLLEITAEVADRWGRLRSEMKDPVPAVDSLLAATALHHDLRLVTRNTADFRYPGLEVVDPWA